MSAWARALVKAEIAARATTAREGVQPPTRNTVTRTTTARSTPGAPQHNPAMPAVAFQPEVTVMELPMPDPHQEPHEDEGADELADDWWAVEIEKRLGDRLLRHDAEAGAVVSTPTRDAVRGKKVGLVFGATWSKRTLGFMYQLASWYKESAAESGVEIVFVSLDKTSDDFAESFDSRHPWLALPFGRRDLNKLICDAVAQEGEIPSLAVFDSDTAELQAVYGEEGLRDWIAEGMHGDDTFRRWQLGTPVGAWLGGGGSGSSSAPAVTSQESQAFARTVMAFAGAKGLQDSVTTLVSYSGGAADDVGRMSGDEQGWTPLHFAALEGHADTVRSLAVCGSNVNAADEKGATALHKAAAGGHIETIEQLLSLGADAHAKDATGRTGLHYAAAHGQHRAARFLITAAQADVAARTHQGETPLHRAAFYGHLDTIRALVELGSDVTAKDDRDKHPKQVAEDNKRDEAAAALQRLIAPSC